METKIGSVALSGKMLLVRIVENDKIDAHLGQVKLRKGIMIGPFKARAPRRCQKREKKPTKRIFNNPRSSIKPGSAPDQNIFFMQKIFFRLIHMNM